MIVSNPSLVPEMQYYMNKFIVNSVVNKNAISFPVAIDPIFLVEGTIVEMLFEEQFVYNDYKYLYTSNANISTWPDLVRTRLMIYKNSKYLIADYQGVNIFNLQEDDLKLLDVLLYYRQGETIIIEDSINFEVVPSDGTSEVIVYGNFDLLVTPLSKLIFLYLDLKLYNRYENYNNLETISSCTLLETYFELILIDEYFKYFTNLEVTFDITCPTI